MATTPFSSAHRLYVKSLYRRMLKNELDWVVRRDIWRGRALMIRAEFERNRDVHDPRALAEIFERAEADLAERQHPDPYIRKWPHIIHSSQAQYRPAPAMPGGTKWERNIPPTMAPLYDHIVEGQH
ncbi:NDUFB9, NADH-ubiquinone oxidoreductase [Pisolithus albus]|nr:NDUFB9, NADH-ubiquinone oxidoreductase [Pisolithus albus]